MWPQFSISRNDWQSKHLSKKMTKSFFLSAFFFPRPCWCQLMQENHKALHYLPWFFFQVCKRSTRLLFKKPSNTNIKSSCLPLKNISNSIALPPSLLSLHLDLHTNPFLSYQIGFIFYTWLYLDDFRWSYVALSR